MIIQISRFEVLSTVTYTCSIVAACVKSDFLSGGSTRHGSQPNVFSGSWSIPTLTEQSVFQARTWFALKVTSLTSAVSENTSCLELLSHIATATSPLPGLIVR